MNACAGAETVFVWSGFDKSCVEALAVAVPVLADELREIGKRIVDMLAMVREHVYHPAFEGSFSIKKVLPALVPEAGYADLEVKDGDTAAGMLEGMLVRGAGASRDELLRYCERDTEGLVRVWKWLSGAMSGEPDPARRDP